MADSVEESVAALLGRLQPLIAASRAHAQELDPAGGFPVADVAAMARAGALAAVVPTLMGGLGIGTEPERATDTARVLHLIGSGSIALGRIFEGHVNAIRLIMLNAEPALCRAAAADARAGNLHALWVTDAATALRFCMRGDAIELSGGKQFCSAAGHATRAVVTATDTRGETRLLLLPLNRGEVTRSLPCGLQGVRSAGTGCVDFAGVRHDASVLFGDPGGYLAEPEFSAGAWRASAVTAGALSALTEATRVELAGRGRAAAPEQRQRLGRMFINAQTALLWLHHVAPIAEDPSPHADFATATVGLARMAIETACTESIQLAQRSLGLSAFLAANPVERLCRDIATYLRQPAPDEALNHAAAFFTAHPAPPR